MVFSLAGSSTRMEMKMTKFLRRTLSFVVLQQTWNDVAVAHSFNLSSSSSCTLCLGTSDIPDPNRIATSNGKTCEELSHEALSHSLDDVECLSHYQLLGYSECGCDTIMPDDHSPPSASEVCTLCHDGSEPFTPDNIDFDSDPYTNVTCGQATDYLKHNHQTSDSCNDFRYKGVVNCGCPLYTINPFSDPACSLCSKDGERVSATERKVYTMSDKRTHTTCGIMEFILAADVDRLYDDQTCSDLQRYFSSLCPCEDATKAPTVTPLTTDSPTPVSTVYPSSLPSSYPSSLLTGASTSPSKAPITKPSTYPTVVPSGSPVAESSYDPSYKPTKAPYALPSSEPSNYPNKEHSQAPTLQQADLPTLSSSPSPSGSPVAESSNDPSYKPTKAPYVRPSSEPSNHPSKEHSQAPSLRRTDLPTLSSSPSAEPTSVIDKEANCTALQAGIMPQIAGIAESTNFELTFDLLLKAKENLSSLPMWGTYYTERWELQQAFAKAISPIVAGCEGDNGLEEKIHYVEMEGLAPIANAECRDSTFPEHLWCVPVISTINIHYSSRQNWRERRLDESAVKAYVESVVEDEFLEMALAVNGIYDVSIVSNPINDEAGGSNVKSPPGTDIGLAVGLGCSFALIVAVGIIARGRRKENTSESANIIAGTHIRSDDSISDNPTISSGRRGMMMGWEGSISDRSNHDARSEVSSRRSQSVQHDDQSRGIEIRQRLTESSYLPASVLKDLLGTDDVEGLSIGEDNDGLSLAPYDESNVVNL